MKKFLSLVLVALMVIPFGMMATTSISAAGTVIYVKDGGTGDGSAADKALASIPAAIDAASKKTEDVTIKLVGEVTMDLTSAHYEEPRHTNKITITGNDANAKMLVQTHETASTAADKHFWIMNGELCFEKVNIEVKTGKYLLVLVTQLNDLTFGEGVNCKNSVEGGNETYTVLIRGMMLDYKPEYHYNAETNTYTANPTITLKSGRFFQVVGYMSDASNKTTAKLNGDVTVNISGTTVIEKLCIVANSYVSCNNATVNLDGGEIVQFLSASDRPGANMSQYGISGVTGTYTLNIGKNFDITKSANKENGSVFYGIGGTTANTGYDLALNIEGNGTCIANIDENVYDAIVAATDKLNQASFDKINKVETPADTGNDDSTTGNNPSTSDASTFATAILMVSVLCFGTVTAFCKKKAAKR